MATALLDAILPAGGRLPAELAQKVGTEVKALIEIDGKPLLGHVLDAVKGSGKVRRIVLIGGPEVQSAFADQVDFVLEEATTGPDNMYNGLEKLMQADAPPTRVLLATTDLPYIRKEHIEQLIAMSPEDRNIVVPLVHRSDFEAEYPGTSSTFVKLKDGEFTLGGMFLMDAAAMARMKPHVAAVFNQRKSKLGMARLLGLNFVVRYFTHSLALSDIEAKIVSLLQCSGKAVPGAPVQFAYDIDDWEDYSYAAARKVTV